MGKLKKTDILKEKAQETHKQNPWKHKTGNQRITSKRTVNKKMPKHRNIRQKPKRMPLNPSYVDHVLLGMGLLISVVCMSS